MIEQLSSVTKFTKSSVKKC